MRSPPRVDAQGSVPIPAYIPKKTRMRRSNMTVLLKAILERDSSGEMADDEWDL
jgi:hypothetical protein